MNFLRPCIQFHKKQMSFLHKIRPMFPILATLGKYVIPEWAITLLCSDAAAIKVFIYIIQYRKVYPTIKQLIDVVNVNIGRLIKVYIVVMMELTVYFSTVFPINQKRKNK